LPQVSEEALDIVNAYINNEINPYTLEEGIVPDNIETPLPELVKLFSGAYSTPGFADLDIPPPREETVYTGEAPTEGPSFADRIGLSMNDSVSYLRD
jgi:hypothetical protein